MNDKDALSKKGRRAGLVIAGTGVFWVLITLIGEKEGFGVQLRLFFDVLALLGFLFAFWLIYQIWRDSRDN
ncbi:DUF5337 domain-containing protein [Roseovarius rhodophyticola]|uniref:DUF5337 domain-containing protein n=1 Tax=Roseovarius rhodophyticola TaxID=3080827 RepID=A0ABZ2TEZ7_9RHOB|nr:DUF5337 domain-containing protein [Roseovarius sp. W115]MDV2931444.1 DUF5337 domain-containing protein [Roseovarius sp. W115]